MSNIVERILEEIAKGNLETEDTNTYPPTFPLGLPHYTYLAEDEVTSVCRQYDSLVCLG
jgi:hypothetical protein